MVLYVNGGIKKNRTMSQPRVKLLVYCNRFRKFFDRIKPLSVLHYLTWRCGLSHREMHYLRRFELWGNQPQLRSRAVTAKCRSHMN
jgi:hypothetical protein